MEIIYWLEFNMGFKMAGAVNLATEFWEQN